MGREIRLGYRPERVTMAINARGQQHRHHKRDKKSPGENPGEERGKRRADQGGILKTNTEVKKEKEIDPDQGGKNREQGAGSKEQGAGRKERERREVMVMVMVVVQRRMG